MASNPKHPKKFLRNALKMPGKSWHSGRGWYDMEHTKTPEQMISGLRELAAKHSFIALSERHTERGTLIISLQFADLIADVGLFGSPENYYRNFQYNTATNELINAM